MIWDWSGDFKKVTKDQAIGEVVKAARAWHEAMLSRIEKGEDHDMAKEESNLMRSLRLLEVVEKYK